MHLERKQIKQRDIRTVYSGPEWRARRTADLFVQPKLNTSGKKSIRKRFGIGRQNRSQFILSSCRARSALHQQFPCVPFAVQQGIGRTKTKQLCRNHGDLLFAIATSEYFRVLQVGFQNPMAYSKPW